MSDDFEVKISPLSQRIEQQGKGIDVQIYEDGSGGWLLEVVDEFDNSTVWDKPFATDRDAMNELQEALLEEGIGALVGQPGNG
ncbi:hypothetical protein KY495_17560 [Massilia sp. PAMC28688]|uniref:hypothetical protein n=1 Tax=Massilia sp. PAMC28688 TaxID=2861283 RepID=UPI001C627509|nr:hypothetical protein [Massilia sp. PAMC28688]QYF92536.1 hypothetical protein KY495_17560 [Massilia sp. PAMC28688]